MGDINFAPIFNAIKNGEVEIPLSCDCYACTRPVGLPFMVGMVKNRKCKFDGRDWHEKQIFLARGK